MRPLGRSADIRPCDTGRCRTARRSSELAALPADGRERSDSAAISAASKADRRSHGARPKLD